MSPQVPLWRVLRRPFAFFASDSAAGRRSFALNLGTVFGGQLACAAVGFIIEVCYARLLGPAGRGQLTLCLMAIAFGALLGSLGGEIPIVIWSADGNQPASQWLSAVMFCGLMGSVTSAGLWAAVYWLWHPMFLRGVTPALAALILATMPISVFSVYLFAMLTGQERFRVKAALAMGNQIAELVGVLVLVLIFGRSAEMAVLGNLAGLLVGTLCAAAILWGTIRGLRKPRLCLGKLASALSLGLRGQLGNVATFFNYRLDVFIVNFFLGPAQLGLYTVGVVISEAIWQIPHATATALFPRTARTIDQGAGEFTCRVLRQTLAIAILSGAALALLAPFLLPFVFGARFSPSVAVIWWILPGTIALSLAKVISADLAARGKPEYSSIFAVVSLGVTTALDFALIPRFGIQGAAIASSTAYLLNTILLAIALRAQLKVSWNTLLVPSLAEFAAYRDAWARVRAILYPASVTAAANRVE